MTCFFPHRTTGRQTDRPRDINGNKFSKKITLTNLSKNSHAFNNFNTKNKIFQHKLKPLLLIFGSRGGFVWQTNKQAYEVSEIHCNSQKWCFIWSIFLLFCFTFSVSVAAVDVGNMFFSIIYNRANLLLNQQQQQQWYQVGKL